MTYSLDLNKWSTRARVYISFILCKWTVLVNKISYKRQFLIYKNVYLLKCNCIQLYLRPLLFWLKLMLFVYKDRVFSCYFCLKQSMPPLLYRHRCHNVKTHYNKNTLTHSSNWRIRCVAYRSNVTNDRFVYIEFHLPDDFVHYFDLTAVHGILFQNLGKSMTFLFIRWIDWLMDMMIWEIKLFYFSWIACQCKTTIKKNLLKRTTKKTMFCTLSMRFHVFVLSNCLPLLLRLFVTFRKISRFFALSPKKKKRFHTKTHKHMFKHIEAHRIPKHIQCRNNWF